MRSPVPAFSCDFRPEIASFLKEIYADCNRLARLERDPLAIALRYPDDDDREVAGLVCSTLAFGAVDLIMRACEKALEPLGAHPAASLASMSDADIAEAWAGFQYRFCFPHDLQGVMRAIRDARREWGSLEGLFLQGDAPGRPFPEAVSSFVRALRRLAADGERAADREEAPGDAAGTDAAASGRSLRQDRSIRQARGIRANLLPDPADGSACKRLFLYLRWMVRRDDIDPGCWTRVSPSRLIVPLDLHMVRTCRERLGFLAPGRAAGKAAGKAEVSPMLHDALQATACFALYSPDDPVKYDFALTRPGIDPRPGDEIYGCL
jgi:uncharacterized protein (TIGR02757 family)